MCRTTTAERMKKSLFCLILSVSLLTGKSVTAQEEFIDAPSQFITRISFTQLTGGIVILQAQLNNFPDTLNFVLDTGSSGISLDSSTVDYLKLNPIASDRTIRGIAGIRNVSFLYNQTIRFPGLTIDSLDMHVNDYSILTSVYGERIDGIIGYSVLSRYILMVNYDDLHIDFYTNGTIRYPRGGYLLRPAIESLPTQTLRIKDDKTITSRFLFDIGAAVCMIFSRDFVQDSTPLNKKRKMLSKEGEGVGGKVDMHATVIKEVKLGPFRFRTVPVYVFDDKYNVTSYPYRGGLIGNDILRRFNVIFNYRNKEFYLTPNSHYDEPFDYSYSGVEFYLVDGIIIVGDVAEKSPAEEAGLKEGDIVIGVNKNFSQNLNQYKIALQNTNEKVKIIVKREGVLKEVEFKVRSIL